MLYTIKGGKKLNEREFKELTLPSGHCFLVFRSKGDFKFRIQEKVIVPPINYIVGQQTESAFMVSEEDCFELSVVALKPTALKHFFNLNMPSLVNNFLRAEDLFDDELKDFKLELNSIKSGQDKLLAIEGLLIDLVNVKKPKRDIIDISIDIIQDKKGCISTKEIANKLNISLRYFQKKFKEVVGIPPSKYTRITRFNYIFAEFNKELGKDVKTLSALFNYYDSAHFSKDFKRYCGSSPTNFHVHKFEFLRDIWIDDPMILKITK